MPKRKHKDSDRDDYILRKLHKLEKKLKKRRQKRSLSSSTNSSETPLSFQKDNQMEESIDLIDVSVDIHEENTIGLPTPEPQNQDCTSQTVELEPQNLELDTTLPPNSETCSVTLDENIRHLLGENPTKDKSYSSSIQPELAVRWEHIVTSGLHKEVKKDLLGKYFVPENCQKLGAPKLNPEIKAALSEALVKKDAVIESKQNQKAVALSCIGQALTKMFCNQNKDTDVIKYLIDASRLLCDSQYQESMSRRSFVTSTIKKDIKDQLFTTEIDSHLFGEKLADTLKAAKAISKSGAEMKTIVHPKPGVNQPRSLNVRPPFPHARQAGAGRRQTPAMTQPRRYQASVPPAPPSAPQAPGYRPPPPPGQPQRSRARTQTRR